MYERYKEEQKEPAAWPPQTIPEEIRNLLRECQDIFVTKQKFHAPKMNV